MMPAPAPHRGRQRGLLYSQRMTRRANRIRLQDHCLAARVCAGEEAAGHPAHSPVADAQARAAGGDLRHRILVRARHLPDAPRLRAALRREVRTLFWLSLMMAIVFAIAGAAAARAALVDTGPVSIPLVGMLVVGPSLVTLLLWLLLLLLGRRRTAAVFPSALASLAARLAGRWSVRPAAPLDCLRSRAAPWLLSSAMHIAWLAYLGAALLTLSLLLSLRSYALVWESTLLSTEALQAWAEALSLGPALFGLAGADTLPLRGALSDAVREAWAIWLLAAVAVYGLLPRLGALLISAAMAWHSLTRDTRALHRPGYARLRERLMPDHQQVEPAAAAPGGVTSAQSAAPQTEGVPPHDGRHVVIALETEPSMQHALPVDWQWLGRVDDLDSLARLLPLIRAEADHGLAVLVRAGAVVDRGTKALLRDLLAASPGAGTLVLLGSANAARLRDWRGCARELGVAAVHWPEGVPPASSAEASP